MTRDGYVPPVFRDFSDLTRQELTDRVRYLETLRARVAYTREHFSPRQLRASGLAMVMSIVVWVFTTSVTCSVISGLVTLAWMLRYSRLPRTWHAQLKEGISRLEGLRSSPLRHMNVEQDAGTDWQYASHCLDAEIERIHFALSEPGRPFSA